MPIYEYRCEACGHALDALQKLSDEPLRNCPACGEPQLRRLISAPAFRLKGGGWYETDFKSDKEKKRNLADDGKGKSESAAAKDGEKKQKPASSGDSSGGEKKKSSAKDGGSGTAVA